MLDRPATRFMQIHETIGLVPTMDRYEFRRDRGWLWLQRLCFWVLNKIGAHYLDRVKTFTRTSRENDDLLKSILRQENHWFEKMHHGRENPQIFIGPDDHADLMQLMHHMGMTPVAFSGRIETRDIYGSKFHNIPITVVPWMSGVLIVPR